MIFEGEYLNSKIWNGKGKEFDCINNEIFDGVYLKGQKNGYIKEYGSYNKLKYEGNFINGLKDGYIKEYYEGALEFEGEYSKGKRNGKGKEYKLKGELIFEGEYLNNKRWNGKGIEYGENANKKNYLKVNI